MMNTRLISHLYWTSILVLFISGVVLPEVISGLRQDYGSTTNFISELGATGADYAFIINHFSFLPVAICSLSAILCLAVRMPSIIGVRNIGSISIREFLNVRGMDY